MSLLDSTIPEQCKAELLTMGYKMEKVLGTGAWGKVICASHNPEYCSTSSSNSSISISTSSSLNSLFASSSSSSSRTFTSVTPSSSSSTTTEEGKGETEEGGENLLVAIKIIDKTKLRDKDWVKVEREMESMNALQSHPSIVKLLQTLETDDFIYFVLEYCHNGDVLSSIQKSAAAAGEGGGFGEIEGKKHFRNLLSALQFTHSQGFIHRDIKLENLLLAKDGTIRLADWGFATRFEYGALLKEFCGSVHYAAPELCCSTPYVGPEVDVWALGVTLYSLVSGCLPFHGVTQASIVKNILRGSYPVLPEFSSEFTDLLERMLVVKVEDRATLEEVFSHSWMEEKEEKKCIGTSPSRELASPSFVTASPFLRFGGSNISNPLFVALSASPTKSLTGAPSSSIQSLPSLTVSPSPTPVYCPTSPVPLPSTLIQKSGKERKHSTATLHKKATSLQTFWRNVVTRRLGKAVAAVRPTSNSSSSPSGLQSPFPLTA